jgi:acyl-ACP dehydrogenase
MTTLAAEAITFDELLSTVFADDFRELTEHAERDGVFPRQLIEELGRAGVFGAVWGDRRQPDFGKLLQLYERLGRLGSASAAAGVIAHDSAVAALRRFASNDYLRDVADRAVRGEVVACLGASEASAGSDVAAFVSTAEPTAHGYRLRGAKKFVSLSPVADVVVVVVQLASSARGEDGLALFVLEADQITVGQPYPKLGHAYLGTAPIEFDVEVSADAMLARPGTGLAAVSMGLAVERLSLAGLVVGACDLAIGLTVAQLMRRKQFGRTLFEHQALRLRFADLRARVDTLRYALKGFAAEGIQGTTPLIRTAAGMKVTAARLGEEVMAECLHVFGGIGYLNGPAPLERWWRDMKLARVAAGADEVLWELVAAGMQPDYGAHDRWVHP